jgi:hypothetical protein
MNDLLVASSLGELQRGAPFGIESIHVHPFSYQATDQCPIATPSCVIKGLWPAADVGRLARNRREVPSTMLADLGFRLNQFSAERALSGIR